MGSIGRSCHRRILITNVFKRLCFRHCQNAAAASEYSETPEYPEILDLSREARVQRKKEAWHQQITQLPTVEQKLIELNMPKYYGYWSLQLSSNQFRLLGDEFCQYATRTHVVEGLPAQYYGDVLAQAQTLTPLVTDKVEQLIELNFNCELHRRNFGVGRAKERHKTQNFLLDFHRVLAGAMSTVPHLTDASVDFRPRVEAFWFLGGMPPDRMLRKIRKNNKVIKHLENEPIDRPIQGSSTPFLGLRVSEGLPDVVPWEDPLATSAPMPDNSLDPRAYGYKFKHMHATTVTGFWPGEKQEHCHLWLHSRENLNKVGLEFGDKSVASALLQRMVISSFTQALSHATYLGFGPVTEVTYPLVQQSAISDGQQWNLSLYQLNTCALHSHCAKDNPHNNILWLGEEEKLFEGVDGGGVKGLNTSLLTSIIAMYLKKGVPRPNPTPYLGPQKRLYEHPACQEYRANFLSYFHNLVSNRPRHRSKPEVYPWEKIYKVDYKTRPFEPPRRFFEPHFNQKDPGTRRLDNYHPNYVPKSLRTKSQQRVKFRPKINSTHLYQYDD